MRAAAVVGMVLLCGIAQGAEPNSIGMELIEIPAGEFTMGSPAGEKDHKADQEQVTVTLTKPFGLGKTEVTQGQWQQVMGTELWKGKPFALADKDCPATYVSFFDAAEFCEKLTDLERKAGKLKANEEYRLPTEAEWEYACRAGTETAFSFGDESKLNSHVWWGGFDLEELSKSGNFEAGPGNAGREQYAHAVGMKKPNPWGLHDMHGNVAEWCSDWYGEKLSGGTDPVGPNGGSKRLTRGGSWWLVPITCRSAFRSSDDPLLRLFGLGFRVARTQSDTVAEQRQQGSQAEPAPPVAEAKRPVQLDVKSNSIGMELIEIPAGEFMMGSPVGEKNRKPDEEQVAVTLTKSFWLGKTEVTQGQWRQVMGTEPWVGKDNVLTDKDCPATYVSWDDATTFCQNLTEIERKAGKLKADEEYRLATEAEWEYACRAGTTTAFSFGDDEKQLGEYAWFRGNAVDAGEQYAEAFGMKKPNPLGLDDMHGNVWEWCSDWYAHALPGGTDPVGPGKGSDRVLRGGSWATPPDGCRSAYRNYEVPSYRSKLLGFRVARSQSETVAERRQQGAQAEPAPPVAEAKRPVQLDVKSNSIGMELIELPAGTFTMGSPAGEEGHQDDEEQVTVTLTKPFLLGKTEVTQGQWRQVMGTEPWAGKLFVLADKDSPATFVSFFDAVEFCEKLTDLERKAGKLKADEEYRLPTEAEWEYACRAGTTTAFSFGDESKLNSHAWWGGYDFIEHKAAPGNAGNADFELHPFMVGLKKPNPWGLYDMHGNVWEWCSDRYGEKLSGGTDPVGPGGGSNRVSRGGSWGFPPEYCRSARRSGSRTVPSFCSFIQGFRVARTQSDTVAEQRQQGAQAEPTPPVAEAKRPVQLDVKSNSIGMKLVELPAGKFTMGQGGGVAVTLTKPFWLGKTEVTQGQWKKVMGTEPWLNKDDVQIGEDNAASYVDWNNATAFCQKLTDLERKAGKLPAGQSYRLPTEAQWEYACRAGTTTTYSFGDDEKQLSEYAWFDGNTAGEQYAHVVALKKPNPWGLHDMHGSVWEWCSDWNNGKLLGGTDPVGPEGGSGRMFRGGSWGDSPGSCLSACRCSFVPSSHYRDLGFRVARSQSEPSQVATAERPVQLEANSIGMKLVELPAGQFLMGDGTSAVGVTLTKPFWLGTTEVTQGQFKRVMGTEPWLNKGDVQIGEDNAASYVDWNDATAFCQRLSDTDHTNGKLPEGESYRLPTEAEWEYACRARTTTAYSFGDNEKQLGEYGWSAGNTAGGPYDAARGVMPAGERYAHKVGMKKPNPWGLHDMHGNVWEWCSDWYDEKLSGGTDPVGPGGGSGRVYRGGGWNIIPYACLSAYRSSNVPSHRYSGLGFRVARSQSERPVQPEVKSKSIVMELIEIPAGKFMMGAGTGAVGVTLTKPFWLGKTEVTQGQLKTVMGTEPWLNQVNVQIGEDNAATYVDWNDAVTFCQRLTDLERKAGTLPAGESYRLPTDAEWEYACRAGTTTAFSFGDDDKQLSEYGWFAGYTTGEQYAHKVGMKKPNPWGLHDMLTCPHE